MTPTASEDQPRTPRAQAGPLVSTPLVSTQWLADHLGSDGLVIADATVLPVTAAVLAASPLTAQLTAQTSGAADAASYVSGDEEYMVNGHVPGAVFADLIDEFSDNGGRFGFARPNTEQFESAAAGLGVDKQTTLIVYDNALGQWAARIWWLFRSFGHENVAVLDGGLRKWVAEDRPIELGYVAARPVERFAAREQPERWADKASVSSIASGASAGSLVCGLPHREFRGDTRGNRPRAGHIPHSISVPASRLVDHDTNAFFACARTPAAFCSSRTECTRCHVLRGGHCSGFGCARPDRARSPGGFDLRRIAQRMGCRRERSTRHVAVTRVADRNGCVMLG